MIWLKIKRDKNELYIFYQFDILFSDLRTHYEYQGGKMSFYAIDLFSGCGGLSEGLEKAGFEVIAGVELDIAAVKTYELNHYKTKIFQEDIRKIAPSDVKALIPGGILHLLAGCPPCQGFSSVRRLNRDAPIVDARNDLILEYYRFVEALQPITIMMENVPGLIEYPLFKETVKRLRNLNYKIDLKIVDISKYGVPQRRKRLVLLGSRIGEVKIAEGSNHLKTVKDAIGNIEELINPDDQLHSVFPKHSDRINQIISLIPLDGGSLKSLPEEYQLKCHQKENVGFNDIYGRLAWNKVSTTITGGCLNPSKGRFLHPEKNRCISAREAALLQTFPPDYIFPMDITRQALALQIGNALPPEFCRQQAEILVNHLNSQHD